jgi:transposase, IS5 family
MCALGTRVIDQARRRVLDGEQVPTSDKIYSIFEPLDCTGTYYKMPVS